MSLTGYLTSATLRSSWANGKRGEPIAHLGGLSCTHLDPVDPGRKGELQHALKIETPHLLLETFVDGTPDIKASDRFTVAGDSKEYIVRGVAAWPKRGSMPAYTHLILEDPSTEG